MSLDISYEVSTRRYRLVVNDKFIGAFSHEEIWRQVDIAVEEYLDGCELPF